jgi:hypothetical protein
MFLHGALYSRFVGSYKKGTKPADCLRPPIASPRSRTLLLCYEGRLEGIASDNGSHQVVSKTCFPSRLGAITRPNRTHISSLALMGGEALSSDTLFLQRT